MTYKLSNPKYPDTFQMEHDCRHTSFFFRTTAFTSFWPQTSRMQKKKKVSCVKSIFFLPKRLEFELSSTFGSVAVKSEVEHLSVTRQDWTNERSCLGLMKVIPTTNVAVLRRVPSTATEMKLLVSYVPLYSRKE